MLLGFNWQSVSVWIDNLLGGKLGKKAHKMIAVKLPFLEKVKENKEEFANKVVEISAKLNCNPAHLMIVMNNESGLNSKIKNPTSSATGLIQFMAGTAKSLGTTTDALKAMRNVEQLDYVYKYMKPFIGHFDTVSDVYLAVFFPKAIFENEQYVFPQWASKANPNFDLNKDGIGTKKEFREYVNKKYAKYLV
jgi:hypothetical protein